MPLSLLLSALRVWMAVEAVPRGQAGSWLWIILFFGPLGAAVYFFSEYLDHPWRWGAFAGRKVSTDEVRRAQADARRLDSTATWGHLASLLRARKEFPKAAEAAEKALARDPKSRDARYELGLALLGTGRPGEAVPHLREGVATDRFFDTGDALFALAEAEKASGDLPSARAHFEELSSPPGRPPVLYAPAEVQPRPGD